MSAWAQCFSRCLGLRYPSGPSADIGTVWKRDPVCQDNTACHNTLVYQDVETRNKSSSPQDSEYYVKTWERRHELRRFFVFQDAVSQDTFSCSKTRCLKSSFHSACQDAVSQVVAQCLTVHRRKCLTARVVVGSTPCSRVLYIHLGYLQHSTQSIRMDIPID